MSTRARVALVAAALFFVLTVAAYTIVNGFGFDARGNPGRFETAVALRLRSMAIPGDARNRTNPEPLTEEDFRNGLAHFADHCSTCHGNDGSGDTDFGRGLYPKPPDMRLARTQDLTDGQLFYIIEHGVPFTGMPGFGTREADGERASWHLVQFIRRLPKLTAEELEHMAELNPLSIEAWLQRLEEEAFLRGGGDPAAAPAPRTSGHGH
ncbi:MAG: cytochrome c [Acidobacteriota bacterium]|nr:cytochrome c [Acidobacteriota bacterium]